MSKVVAYRIFKTLHNEKEDGHILMVMDELSVPLDRREMISGYSTLQLYLFGIQYTRSGI